jgi:heme/copper-type cytochrome/quinol oxidase subunit 4
MSGRRPVRDITTFVSLYLLLSLPPFLYLNQDLSAAVANIALVATAGTVVLVLVASLFFISDGVERYTDFFFAVTDVYSVVVDLAFVLGAVSWWVVPELATRFELGAQLRYVLAAIIICHVPMVLFLSLLTIMGRARTAA